MCYRTVLPPRWRRGKTRTVPAGDTKILGKLSYDMVFIVFRNGNKRPERPETRFLSLTIPQTIVALVTTKSS